MAILNLFTPITAGHGVSELLERVVRDIPPPARPEQDELQAHGATAEEAIRNLRERIREEKEYE